MECKKWIELTWSILDWVLFDSYQAKSVSLAEKVAVPLDAIMDSLAILAVGTGPTVRSLKPKCVVWGPRDFPRNG